MTTNTEINGLPKKTVPLEEGDWKGLWWIKDPRDESCVTEIDYVGPYGVGSLTLWGPYQSLMRDGWLRSQDGITWTPCSKEVEA